MSDEKNPAATLDRIRDGGINLVLVTRARIRELQEALDEGRFSDALERLGEAHTALSRLAGAEDTLGKLARSTIVRARDLVEGMLVGPGPLSEVEVEETECTSCAGNHCRVTLRWDNGAEREHDGSDEVLVFRSSD